MLDFSNRNTQIRNNLYYLKTLYCSLACSSLECFFLINLVTQFGNLYQ